MDFFEFLNRKEGRALRKFMRGIRKMEREEVALQNWKQFEDFAGVRWVNTIWECIHSNIPLETPDKFELYDDPIATSHEYDFFSSLESVIKGSWVLLSPKEYLNTAPLLLNPDRPKPLKLVAENLKSLELDTYFVPSVQIYDVIDDQHKIRFRVPIVGDYYKKIISFYNEKESTKAKMKECLSGFIGEDYILEDRFSVHLDSLNLTLSEPVERGVTVQYRRKGKYRSIYLHELPPSLIVTLTITYIDESELLEGGERYEEAKKRFEQ